MQLEREVSKDQGRTGDTKGLRSVCRRPDRERWSGGMSARTPLHLTPLHSTPTAIPHAGERAGSRDQRPHT